LQVKPQEPLLQVAAPLVGAEQSAEVQQEVVAMHAEPHAL
jgi:hypothetical protein